MKKIGEIAIADEVIMDIFHKLQELQKQYPDHYLETGEVVHSCNPYKPYKCDYHGTFEIL